ncbi:MAG: hypothetical protein U5K75_11330 [Ahrensia sp.]|nr:hypothetical protein [Ahrensia sp.]
MNSKYFLTVLTLLTLSNVPTYAQASDVEFNSNVNTTCSINVTRNGTLRTATNARILTSSGAGAGGVHGTASVTATSNNFRLYVDQPTGFTSRPAADTEPDQLLRARMRSSGATTFGFTTNNRPLNSGISNVTVEFYARKAAGKSFADGNYTATVVIRCE